MKVLLAGILVSFSVGIWFGINIGQGNALYDIPDFDTVYDAHESAEDAGLIEQGTEFVEEQKEALTDKAKEKLEDMVDEL